MGSVKKIPLRKCIGCGEMKNKKEMMRVIRTPENQVTLDVTGKRRRDRSGCYRTEKRTGRLPVLFQGLPRESHEEPWPGAVAENRGGAGRV